MQMMPTTMTMTATTLIEDVSNKCWASGPVGMSDGVMTPRENVGNLVERMAWGQDTHNTEAIVIYAIGSGGVESLGLRSLPIESV